MKMFRTRASFAAVALAAIMLVLAAPSRGGLSQQQRSQQTVYILANITGIASLKVPPPSDAPVIAARFALRAKGSQPSVDSYALNGSGTLVAQTQSAVRVQAEVTPNPNATLLVTNKTSITLSGTAGTTIHASCVYTVTSNAISISQWTIRQGLANDFISGTWPGSDLANNSYLSTPQPAATPFVVYPSAWTNMATNGAQKTYCVDLSLIVPSNVPTGAYSTTAVYTIWY